MIDICELYLPSHSAVSFPFDYLLLNKIRLMIIRPGHAPTVRFSIQKMTAFHWVINCGAYDNMISHRSCRLHSDIIIESVLCGRVRPVKRSHRRRRSGV